MRRKPCEIQAEAVESYEKEEEEKDVQQNQKDGGQRMHDFKQCGRFFHKIGRHGFGVRNRRMNVKMLKLKV